MWRIGAALSVAEEANRLKEEAPVSPSRGKPGKMVAGGAELGAVAVKAANIQPRQCAQRFGQNPGRGVNKTNPLVLRQRVRIVLSLPLTWDRPWFRDSSTSVEIQNLWP